jgi:hypothetical protein
MTTISRDDSLDNDEEINEDIITEKLSEIRKALRKNPSRIENVYSILKQEDDFNNLLKSFKAKIKFLEDKHEYSDLIRYYEDKIESTKQKCYSYIQLFSKLLKGLSTNNSNVYCFYNIRGIRYGTKWS